MAKVKITVLEKRVGTICAKFGFGRDSGDGFRWRDYRIANVSKASALRFDRAFNVMVHQVQAGKSFMQEQLLHELDERLSQQGDYT